MLRQYSYKIQKLDAQMQRMSEMKMPSKGRFSKGRKWIAEQLAEEFAKDKKMSAFCKDHFRLADEMMKLSFPNIDYAMSKILVSRAYVDAMLIREIEEVYKKDFKPELEYIYNQFLQKRKIGLFNAGDHSFINKLVAISQMKVD